MATGRKLEHRISAQRKPPEPMTTQAISYRTANPALGYDKDGEVKVATERACYVLVLSVERATLADATDADARAEGWKGRRELLEAWGVDLLADDPAAIGVWVVRWRRDPEARPRFLSARVIAGRQGDYTEVPARRLAGEPEPVGEGDLVRFTRVARAREADRCSGEIRQRRCLDFDRQVQVYEGLARERFIDIRDELRAIRRWRDPHGRQRQLARIRDKVDGAAAI